VNRQSLMLFSISLCIRPVRQIPGSWTNLSFAACKPRKGIQDRMIRAHFPAWAASASHCITSASLTKLKLNTVKILRKDSTFMNLSIRILPWTTLILAPSSWTLAGLMDIRWEQRQNFCY